MTTKHPQNLNAMDSRPQISLLDCSLRDGGYLNQWDFPMELVCQHIRLLNELEVPLVEVGFRSSNAQSLGFEGLLRHSPPTLLADLKTLAPNIRLGVMINAADFPNADTVQSAFSSDLEQGALAFVRIATLAEVSDIALSMVERLVDLGLQVFLNVMQADSLETRILDKILRETETCRLEGLYFADTFGAMQPQEVENLVQYVGSRSPHQIGGHFHDNLGLAIANSLAAVRGGASLIDATVRGIGRGAGNTQLEQLLLEDISETSLPSLAELVNEWKNWAEHPREAIPEWGPSLEYALAARKGVHPTYVQRLTETESHSPKERVVIINELGASGGRVYAEQAPDVGDQWFDVAGRTDPNLSSLLENKKVLLVGGGESVRRYSKKIRSFAARGNTVVLAVGSAILPEVEEDLRLVSDPATILAKGKELFHKENLLAPFSQLPSRVAGEDCSSRNLGFEVRISEHVFGFQEGTLYTFSSRSSICALALLCGVKTEEILFAGFDGYQPDDARNSNFSRALENLWDVQQNLLSLTPSQFNFKYVAES